MLQKASDSVGKLRFRKGKRDQQLFAAELAGNKRIYER